MTFFSEAEGDNGLLIFVLFRYSNNKKPHNEVQKAAPWLITSEFIATMLAIKNHYRRRFCREEKVAINFTSRHSRLQCKSHKKKRRKSADS
jgi:hypothetical protein